MLRRVILCIAALASSSAVSAPHDTSPAKVPADQSFVLPLARGELTQLEASAAAGDVRSQLRLGNVYYFGVGIAQDFALAEQWYRKAAGEGSAQAQTNLGEMFDKGKGVAQDDTEALRWYRMAAEKGHPRAQYAVGTFFGEGRGVPVNERQAVEWYSRAAKQNYVRAQFNLANMLADGRGIPKNEKEAVRLYRLAARGGYPEAQFNLGLMYANGHGVPADDGMAYMWMAVVQMGKDFLQPGAEQALRVLTSRMDSDAVGRARSAAEKCEASRFQACQSSSRF